MTDDEFDAMQADYDLCGVDGRLRDFAEAVQAACERAALDAVAEAKSAERERCASICDEAKAAIWPYHEPEVLNRCRTVCENLASRIRGIGA